MLGTIGFDENGDVTGYPVRVLNWVAVVAAAV